MNLTTQATSGGPHPASVYADQAVNQIISIAPTAQGQTAEQGDKLRTLVRSYLEGAFSQLQEYERLKLNRDSNYKLTPLTDFKEVSDVAQGVFDLSEGSVHELHFKQDHVKVFITNIIGHHIATLRDVERKWHADKKG